MATPSAGVTISGFESGATNAGCNTPSTAPRTIHTGNKLEITFRVDSIEHRIEKAFGIIASPLFTATVLVVFIFIVIAEEAEEEDANTVETRLFSPRIWEQKMELATEALFFIFFTTTADLLRDDLLKPEEEEEEEEEERNALDRDEVIAIIDIFITIIIIIIRECVFECVSSQKICVESLSATHARVDALDSHL